MIHAVNERCVLSSTTGKFYENFKFLITFAAVQRERAWIEGEQTRATQEVVVAQREIS